MAGVGRAEEDILVFLLKKNRKFFFGINNILFNVRKFLSIRTQKRAVYAPVLHSSHYKALGSHLYANSRIDRPAIKTTL